MAAEKKNWPHHPHRPESRSIHAGVDVRTLPIRFKKLSAGDYGSGQMLVAKNIMAPNYGAGDFSIRSYVDRGTTRWHVYDRAGRRMRLHDSDHGAFSLASAIHDLHYKIARGIVNGFGEIKRQLDAENARRDAEEKRARETEALAAWLREMRTSECTTDDFAATLWRMGARVE